MRNSNTIKNQGLSLLTALCLFTLILTGCNKQVDITPVGSFQTVTMDEIKQWTASFIPKMQDQPSFLYELAQKTTVKGKSYIRIPVLGSKGESLGFFYFTKTAEAKFQSLYIIADQKDKSKLDGVVGFIDFDNKTYTVATYQDNKLTGLYEMKDTRSFFAGAFTTGNSGAIRQKINDACPEVTSIVRLADGRDSVVIKTNGTGIGCPSAGGETGGFWAAIWKGITDFLNGIGTFFDTLFGGSSSGYTGGFAGGSAFGIGGYSGWGFGGFVSGGYGVGYSGGGGGGGGYTDPVTGGTGPYDPYRGAWEPYDPNANSTDVLMDDSDLNVGYDDGSGNSSGVDNTPFQRIDPTKPIPTITDIMGVNNFVKRLTSHQNCLELSRQQINVLGYSVGGWNPGGQTFQIYTRANGVNQTVALDGISYMVSALQRNIPVVIGVDYGNPSPNLDHTTNHFVVVVGMGTDANGRIYFRFYDNYTANPVYGTSQLNTVTYNSATGELTGGFIGVQNRVPPISYKVAQIRKSFK